MPLYHVDPGSEAALIKVNDDVDLIKISVGTMDNNAYLIHPGAGPAILVDAAAEPGDSKPSSVTMKSEPLLRPIVIRTIPGPSRRSLL